MVARHPKGLWILAFGEMWDRFSYYGIATIMTLYLAHVFLFSDDHVYSIAGVYNTLGFGLPILGGFVADRLLGYRRAIMLGAVLIIFGNLVLIFKGIDGVYIGFSLVVVGIGLFKANITSQLGTLYPDHDKRKEGAFAVFYMGMNLGALLGPIVFGVTVAVWGWHAGFAFSAVGMFISLITYYRSRHYLGSFLVDEPQKSTSSHLFFILLLILVIAGVALMFSYPGIFGDFVWIFALCMVVGLCYIASKRTPLERRHILAFTLFTVFSIFYFACSRQTNTSLLLFINRVVDHQVFGLNIPPEWFASLTPIYIMISLLLVTPFWNYLGRINKQPPAIFLVALGLMFGGLSFVVFALAAYVPVIGEWNFPLYLVFFGFFLLGLGELCIMPTVTSMVTELAPKDLKSTFMGFWFLSSAFSAYVGSLMAKLGAISSITASATITRSIYAKAFLEIAVIVFVVLVITILTMPLMKRLIK